MSCSYEPQQGTVLIQWFSKVPWCVLFCTYLSDFCLFDMHVIYSTKRNSSSCVANITQISMKTVEMLMVVNRCIS